MSLQYALQLGPTALFETEDFGPATIIENAVRIFGNLCRSQNPERSVADNTASPEQLLQQVVGCEVVVTVTKTLVKSFISRPFDFSVGDNDVRFRIARQCIKVIGNISHRGEVFIQHLGALGSCELSLMLLKALYYNERFCEHACAAIGNLSHCDENRQRFADSEGCELLISALRTHSKNETVVQLICVALFNLSVNDKIKLVLLALHADEDVEKVLRGLSASSKAFHEARDTLLRISESSVGCGSSSGEIGAACVVM